MKYYFIISLLTISTICKSQDSVRVITLGCSVKPGIVDRKIPLYHYGILFWKYNIFQLDDYTRERDGFYLPKLKKCCIRQERLPDEKKWKTTRIIYCFSKKIKK